MQGIVTSLKSLLGIHFDPAAHAVKSPWRDKPKPGRKRKPALQQECVHHVGTSTFVDMPPPGDAHTEWAQADLGALQGRTAKLTPADLTELEKAGIFDPAKAGEIKALWALGKSNKTISKELTKKHGKGFSLSTIAHWVPCFVRAMEMQEEPVAS